MKAIYCPQLDPETFAVKAINSDGDVDPCRQVFRAVDLSAVCIRAGPGGDQQFLVAYAVVISGERNQRVAIKRKLDRNTRNIQLRVQAPDVYLKRLLEESAKREPKPERKRMQNQMETDLREAMSSVRESIGLGDSQPSRHSYRVTEDAIAATGNPELQNGLRSWVTRGDLSEGTLDNLRSQLRQKYPQDADAVLLEIEKTQSQEHLSAISLQTLHDKLLVTIVNSKGQCLSLPEHKFRGLLSNPGVPRHLHKYTWEDRKQKEVQFVFSKNTNGIVVGKLDAAACVLDVVCLDDDNRAYYHDRALFLLDIDYACCLYIVLSRLREDSERFDRLLEQAEATAGFDPFDGVLSPADL